MNLWYSDVYFMLILASKEQNITRLTHYCVQRTVRHAYTCHIFPPENYVYCFEWSSIVVLDELLGSKCVLPSNVTVFYDLLCNAGQSINNFTKSQKSCLHSFFYRTSWKNWSILVQRQNTIILFGLSVKMIIGTYREAL